MNDVPYFRGGQDFEIMESDKGFMANEPGVMLAKTVVRRNRNGHYSVLVVNNTNKTVRVKRRCVIGKAETLEEVHAFTVGSAMTRSDHAKEKHQIDLSEIDASDSITLTLYYQQENAFAVNESYLACPIERLALETCRSNFSKT